MDALEPDPGEREAQTREEQDILGQNEKLGQQLAELYNENTLLRDRVRLLESEMRRVSKRG